MAQSWRILGGLLLWVGLMACWNGSAQAAELLNPHVRVLFDQEQRSLERIAAVPDDQWQPLGGAVPNFGYQDATLWVLLEFPAAIRQEHSLVELRWPFYDSVQWFTWDSAGIHGPLLALGDHEGTEDRDLSGRFPVWNVPAHGEGVRFLLRLQSSGLMLLPLYHWEVQTYIRQEQRTQMLLGLLLGTLLLMLLYNLGVWWQVRDRSYLFYVGYVAAVTLYQASLYGVGFQYGWHGMPYLADKMLALSVGCSFLFGALFFTSFLQLEQRWPPMHRVVLALAGVYAVFTLAAFVVAEKSLVALAQSVGTLMSVTGLLIAGREWYRGNPVARYFTIAWVFLLVGTCIYTATLADLLPYNPFTEVVQTVGIVVEVVLLSLALGARIAQDRVARKQAMEVSLALAQQVNLAHQETIRVQEQAKQELEEKVIQRTQELEQANARLAQLSVTDPLTGLKNRRYFSEQFDAEFERALRERQPLSLLAIDLDHFKQINDTHGHPAGDECLRAVAAVLLDHCRRPGDMAVRLGGEEMALLLVNTDRDGAVYIAESVRRRIEALAIRLEQRVVSLTTSVGVVTVVPTPADSMAWVLEAADQALYRAKREGRNRVVVAGPRGGEDVQLGG